MGLGWRAEVGSQKSEVGKCLGCSVSRVEGGGWRAEVGSLRSEDV